MFSLNRVGCFAIDDLRVAFDRYFRYSGFLSRGERRHFTVSKDIAEHTSALESLNSLIFISEVVCRGRDSSFLAKGVRRDPNEVVRQPVQIAPDALCEK